MSNSNSSGGGGIGLVGATFLVIFKPEAAIPNIDRP